MSKSASVLLSGVAIALFSAIAAAPASAHFWDLRTCFRPNVPSRLQGKWTSQRKCEERNPFIGEAGGTWEHEPNRVSLTGTRRTSFVLAGDIGGTKVTVTCKGDSLSAKIDEEGVTENTLSFKECSLEPASKCTVSNITTEVTGELTTSEPVEDELKEKGKELMSIVVSGTECTLAGTYAVKGSQKCKLPGGEEFTSQHELECTKAGSSLTLDGEAASAEVKLALESGCQLWAAEP